jgi:hypothetical protein
MQRLTRTGRLETRNCVDIVWLRAYVRPRWVGDYNTLIITTPPAKP